MMEPRFDYVRLNVHDPSGSIFEICHPALQA